MTNVPFECVSGTTWDGAWVGHTVTARWTRTGPGRGNRARRAAGGRRGDFLRVALLALAELAHLAGAAGAAGEAARLLGACRTARRVTGLVPNGEQRRWIAETTAAISTRLGTDQTSAVLAEGEQLSFDEAVTYVRRARGSGAARRPAGRA